MNHETEMTPEQKLAFFQEIVDTQSFKEHDEMIVDMFTASCVVQIHNALNDKNKEKLLSLSIQEICRQSMQLVKQLQL